MLFRRIITPGLAHHSYLLECGGGVAVVVDPRRDIAEYLDGARSSGLVIGYVLETHRQEDFELGSAALAAATGASIVTGDHPLSGRSDMKLADGGELRVGETRFVALHTPGHTPESVCYAAYRKDAGEACWAVFTGDALFVGETGRTDLEDPARTADNAGALHDALHARLAPLGDQALVFPAHGAGSACGGAISDRDESSLGIERRTNPAFTLGRREFIEHKLAEKLPRPPYFSRMERVNLEGGRPLDWPRPVAVLPPRDFRAEMARAIVLDTRSPDAFAAAHVPGSYNVWLGGLSTFAGWIAGDADTLLLIVDAPAAIETAMLALGRVGFDRVGGVLAGGIPAWREEGLPIAGFGTAGAVEVEARWRRGEVSILDVRDDREWSSGHIPGAVHVYAGELERNLSRVPRNGALAVHCSVGNRSGIAASVLHRHGFDNLYNMLGGMKAWRSLGFPVEQ